MTQTEPSHRETRNRSQGRLASLSRLDELLLTDSRDSQEEECEEVGGR